MLISIGQAMAMTWCLCKGLCGINVKLMLGRMLASIKSKMKPRLKILLQCLVTPTKERP